eukprot:g852.t1
MALNFGSGRGGAVVRQEVYRRTPPAVKAKKTQASILTSPLAVSLDHFLNHSMAWAFLVCVLTIWALYIDDIRLLHLPKDSDPAFATINWLIFAVFMAEWVIDSLVHVNYFMSLTSMMDLLAAASLIPIQEILNDANADLSVARIARTFRALRILRATRAAAMALKAEATLKRAAKARRASAAASLAQAQMEKGLSTIEPDPAEGKSLLEATLLERGNVKMLLGVLILLMGMSFIDYSESDRSAEASLALVDIAAQELGPDNNMSITNGTLCTRCSVIAELFKRNVEYDKENTFLLRRVFFLQVAGHTWITESSQPGYTNDYLMDVRRPNEYEEIVVETPWGGGTPRRTVARIDLKPLFDLRNLNSIYSTTFSIVVIIIWAMSFRRDYRVLVLRPVRRMVQTLKDMTNNPRDAIAKGMLYAKSNKVRGSSGNTENMSEMELIEACVAKFGLLLKVGFGEAGMNIIARNMGRGNMFDPVTPGTKVYAVIGFCDIRNFTDCCEVLEEETMVFTNSIASIVHNRVHSLGGVVNKNIGDAFLMVWKLKRVPVSTGTQHGTKKERVISQHPSVPHIAGSSSSTKANIPDVSGTNTVTQADRQRRKSTFGIGAQKLASAGLGGHVGVSKGDEEGYRKGASGVRARRASLLHGVQEVEGEVSRYVHFISNSFSVVDDALESFIRIRSALVKDLMIQKVASDPRLQSKIPGYSVKMGYGLHIGWAIEGAIGSPHKVDASYLSPHVNMAARLEAASKQYKVQLLLSDAFVKEIANPKFKAGCRPLDVVTVKGSNVPVTLYTYQPNETPEDMDDGARLQFRDFWLEAFDTYVSGDWDKTRALIEQCLNLHPEDGPCQTMLRVIGKNGAPADWKGYRADVRKYKHKRAGDSAGSGGSTASRLNGAGERNGSQRQKKARAKHRGVHALTGATIEEVIKDDIVSSNARFGIRFLVKHWYALATARRSVDLLSKVFGLAAKLGMSLDEMVGLSGDGDSHGESVNPMATYTRRLLMPLTPSETVLPRVTYKELPSIIRDYIETTEGNVEDRWMILRNDVHGKLRFFVTAAFERDICTCAEIMHAYMENKKHYMVLWDPPDPKPVNAVSNVRPLVDTEHLTNPDLSLEPWNTAYDQENINDVLTPGDGDNEEALMNMILGFLE